MNCTLCVGFGFFFFFCFFFPCFYGPTMLYNFAIKPYGDFVLLLLLLSVCRCCCSCCCWLCGCGSLLLYSYNFICICNVLIITKIVFIFENPFRFMSYHLFACVPYHIHFILPLFHTLSPPPFSLSPLAFLSSFFFARFCCYLLSILLK